MKLQDRVAIVTGGASGIGRGVAHAMAKEGAKVVIVDVNEEQGLATEQELNAIGQGKFIKANISDSSELKRIVEETVQAYGKINVLVNNAHVSKQVMFVDTTPEDLALSFNTSFYPTFTLMQLCYPYLKETKGAVINFASGAGLSGMPTQAAYGSAKEAIRGLSRVVANEWGVDGINVNCISPIANSPGVQKWSQYFPAEYEAMVNNIPLKRVGDCENDIGRIAVFLASDDSSYMTGQTLMADGGSVMLR
ncbi:SDR family NAD(P)-dependent oxidoreductase [Paenibacillus sp. NEAU-GSW1]|uniref:SDR family NAD(P)-dependent oxidoreductase n=1 Tax=Paenibacillus sp. NEAU-GSW1 TaxID=2682486 RepID=UPI0012E31CE0|nr:SDR family oxidoreductase [Paenibacillus sp. NEAU-GSW1]MUT68298.1 SDR family oxidoreductase [Paenibacillus sp. NEAU-GSW1]